MPPGHPKTPPPSDPDTPADGRFADLRMLRRYKEGALGYFERRADVKFIIEAASGKLVLPVEPGFAKATSGAEFLLFLPTESDWVMHLALEPALIERPESEESCDRWRGHHGQPTGNHWIRCAISGGKTESSVFDGESVQVPNALGRAEYPLIRYANADRALLSAACKKHGAMLVADPQCVGVDPFGIDVKARFGILRIEFPPGIVADTPDLAQREIDRLFGKV